MEEKILEESSIFDKVELFFPELTHEKILELSNVLALSNNDVIVSAINYLAFRLKLGQSFNIQEAWLKYKKECQFQLIGLTKKELKSLKLTIKAFYPRIKNNFILKKCYYIASNTY